MGRRSARLITYDADTLMFFGSCCSTLTSPSWTMGLTQSGTWPRVVWVSAGGAKLVTTGVRAPGKGAVGVAPGGVKIRFGNCSVGQVVGLQLNVCWMTPFSTRVA